jgi:stage II sporulation protein R
MFLFYGKNSKVSATAINNEASQETISEKIIRFHILANSDSNEDQMIKLKIRDAVLEFIAPMMNKCTSLSQSEKILKDNDYKINQIAKNILAKNGYKYGVKTELTKVEFPIKSYGDIILPQGKYEAYRILLGNAKGHNWWCVMFPPLCFTDITRGNVEIEKTKDEMKKVLTPEEYKLVVNSNGQNGDKIIVKFKVVEEFEKLVDYFKKIINR